jgi:hypothetical protein
MPKRSPSADAAAPKAKKGGKPESNEDMAAAFDQLKMYEMKSGGHHAAVAYDKVAKAIRMKKSIISAGADMGDVAGVGKASVAKMDEFLTSGKIGKLEEFRKNWGELPAEVTQALKSGAGKKAAAKAKNPISATTLKKIKAAEAEFDPKSNDTLKALLRQNGGMVSGNKADLSRRCAEGKVLGAFPRCPLCHAGKPKLDFKTGAYTCPGFMDDDKWAPCIFKGDLKRDPWAA